MIAIVLLLMLVIPNEEYQPKSRAITIDATEMHNSMKLMPNEAEFIHKVDDNHFILY